MPRRPDSRATSKPGKRRRATTSKLTVSKSAISSVAPSQVDVYQVVVTCDNEEQQRLLYQQLVKTYRRVRLLVL